VQIKTTRTEKLSDKILGLHKECEDRNPHLTPQQIADWVFLKVFGEYRGTESDKRNHWLCRLS
jgi:hypothetical protein